MKPALALVAFALLLGTAVHAQQVSFSETYEDDSDQAQPTGDYALTVTPAGTCTLTTSDGWNVDGTLGSNSSKSYRYGRTGSGGACQARFNFGRSIISDQGPLASGAENCGDGRAAWDFRIHVNANLAPSSNLGGVGGLDGGGTVRIPISLPVSSARQVSAAVSAFGGSPSSSQVAFTATLGVWYHVTVYDVCVRVNDSDSCTGGNPVAFSATFKFSGGDLPAPIIVTPTVCVGGDGSISNQYDSIAFRGAASTNNWRARADNLCFSTLCDLPPVDNSTLNEPSEFDSGLRDFAAGLGFKTPASQFLFILILVALSAILGAVLLSIMGEGRWKIWAVYGLTVTVGIFGVILGYLEGWIATLAIVLSLAGVQGLREFSNTIQGWLKRSPPAARLAGPTPTAEGAAAAAPMGTGTPADTPMDTNTPAEASSASPEPAESSTPEPSAPEPSAAPEAPSGGAAE